MRISYCSHDTSDTQPWLDALGKALPGAEISAWAPGAPLADYAIVWRAPQVFFDEQTQLKAIFNTGAGIDALARLKLPAGVPVIRLEDAGMAAQMAEYVAHALIRHVREFDVYEAQAERGEWAARPLRSRRDFPVGVMGLGALGERVAQVLTALDFPVNGWSRSPKTLPGVRCYVGDEFHDFLRASRVLVSLLPLTPATTDLMNRETLSMLRPGAYVINVARGLQLVEDDLLALLDSGHVAGATLDVFRTEPLPAGHPFWSHPKVHITPHSSANTVMSDSVDQIVGKLKALDGGAPLSSIGGVVDASTGY